MTLLSKEIKNIFLEFQKHIGLKISKKNKIM